jgi:hypothetical protein
MEQLLPRKLSDIFDTGKLTDMFIIRKCVNQMLIWASLSLFLPIAVCSQSGEFSQESQRKLQKRETVIQNEIDELKSHPWAGRYQYGGPTSSFRLTIAPESGFAFSSGGCMGIYGLNYGTVQATDGVLKLVPQEKNRRGDFWGISTDLLLIPWGERHYLIPAPQILEFINAINSGFEPRKTVSGFFFLKWGDEYKPVAGKPKLPSEYADYLLENPIQARITSHRETRVEGNAVHSSVVLDVGKAQGVRVGMQFYFQNSLRYYPPAVITVVNDSNSVAELVQFVGGMEQLSPRPGLPLSTLAGRVEFE